jgi:hypothetical protein
VRRYTALAVAALAVAAASAQPAHAAEPLLADFWDVKLQSTNPHLKGQAGRRTSVWSFDRPDVMNVKEFRMRRRQKLTLKPSAGGWRAARVKVRQGCYRADYIYRVKPTRVHDIHGERVASRAQVKYFNAWRTCSGDSFRSWFKGTAKRPAPQAGPADIIASADDCDTTLVTLSGSEDAGFFFEWDGTFSYLWDFGDGSTSTQAEPKHRYPGPGNYTATVLIRELDGNSAKGSQTVEVRPPQDCG